MSAVLKNIQTLADPLLQFLEADVPLRTLLEHGVERLDWLAALDVSPIFMTYPDGRGGMVVEEVSKLALLERAHELGWAACDERVPSIEFEKAIGWSDDQDHPERVPGIWFAHEECMDWNAGTNGAPVTIRPDRLSALQSEAAQRRASFAAQRAEQEAVNAMHEEASRRDRLLQSRIHGRLDRDGVTITCAQALTEIEAIAAVHGVYPESDDTFSPFPWSPEQQHELARVMRFVNDVVAGKQAGDCIPLEPYAATQLA